MHNHFTGLLELTELYKLSFNSVAGMTYSDVVRDSFTAILATAELEAHVAAETNAPAALGRALPSVHTLRPIRSAVCRRRQGMS